MLASKRARIRTISFLTALVVALGGSAAAFYLKYASMRRAVDNIYEHSLNEASSYLYNIAVSLEKSAYTFTPAQLSVLSAQLWQQTNGAKNALEMVPVDAERTEQIYKFLSQVGDYSLALARKSANGGELSEEERQNLVSMRDHAGVLNAQIEILRNQITEQGYSFAGYHLTPDVLPLAAPATGGFVAEEMRSMETGFESFPMLIYDGPFSDHILSAAPRLTEGKAEVTKEQAKLLAARATGVEPLLLNELEDENSNMPSYCFGNDELYVTVTRLGGYTALVKNMREVGAAQINGNEAVEIASAYLKRLGYESMANTYFEIFDDICTINFAYYQGGILYYPDHAKVQVALDDGSIVGFEARSYIMNHTERENLFPQIAADTADELLGQRGLSSLEPARLALIPTSGQNEVLCYEYLLQDADGRKALIYLNAATGEEENVLILIETETGVLTK